MPNHFIYILTLFILLLFSCQKKETPILQTLSFETKHSDSINISHLDLDFNLFVNYSYQPLNKDYIYIYNIHTNKLLLYSFRDKNIQTICNIEKQYDILSFDINDEQKYISFILSNDKLGAFSLNIYNFQGELISEKKLGYLNEYSNINLFNHYLIDSIHYFGSITYSPKDAKKKQEFLAEKSILMYWNLKEDYMEALPISYPKDYHHKYIGININVESKIINDSLQAFSFLFTDSIYLYNIKTRKIKAYNAKSRLNYQIHLPEYKELANYHSEITNVINLDNSMYFNLKYFPQQKLYSRFFKYNKKIIQVFYDSNFNYLGEINPIGTNVLMFDCSEHLISISFSEDKQYLIQKGLSIEKSNTDFAHLDSIKKIKTQQYLQKNFDAGVQRFLEKTKLIPAKNDSIIIYQSTHCTSCVQSAALDFLKEKDNKNTTIIVFDQSDKEMLANHIFLSPIVLCEDNSLSEEGYYHHMPHLYFWKGDKVTSSPIVKEAQEENI